MLKLLLKTPKNDHYVSTYLLDIKKTVDTLAAMGIVISTEEHIETILDGLSDEYDGFITSIISRTNSYSVDDLEALLVPQEKCFEKHITQSYFLHANTISGNVMSQIFQMHVLSLISSLIMVVVCLQKNHGFSRSNNFTNARTTNASTFNTP